MRSASCLAVASLQKLANKQPVSIRQLMETERVGVATVATVPKTRGVELWTTTDDAQVKSLSFGVRPLGVA